MKATQQQLVATSVKEARLAKGFTQKELSEKSQISIRSIQRIENGEIVPRSYTLKTLSGILGLSFEELQTEVPAPKVAWRMNRFQKIILSIAIPLIILLASLAFIAQSPGFPETGFESLVLALFVLLVTTLSLTLIWRTKA